MNLIVAVSKNYGIGKDNKLLFSISEDMKYFKEKTLNNVVVMGYNTYNSLPSKPLKNRTTIVLCYDKSFVDERVNVVYSLAEALKEIEKYPSEKVFICGGASIYRQFLPLCDKAYITKVNKIAEADTFFPNLDEDKNWKMTYKSEKMHSGELDFWFTEYTNRRKL